MSALAFAALGGLIALAGVAPADPVEKLAPTSWTLDLGDGPPSPGATLTIRVLVRIEEGWRLYSLTQPPGGPVPTRIWLAEGQPWVLAGPVRGPDPVKEFDAVFGMEVETYSGRVQFELPVEGVGEPLTSPIQVRARYQMCNGELCLRPKTLRLELPIGHDLPEPSAAGTAPNRPR